MKVKEYWKEYVSLNLNLKGVNCPKELYYNNDDYNMCKDCENFEDYENCKDSCFELNEKMITIVSKRHLDDSLNSNYKLDELFIQFVLNKYDIYEEMEEVYDEIIGDINILELLKDIGFNLIYKDDLTCDNF